MWILPVYLLFQLVYSFCFIKIYLCVCVFTSVRLCALRVYRSPWRPEKGLGSPGTGVTDMWKLSTDPQASARPINTFKHWVIFQILKTISLEFFKFIFVFNYVCIGMYTWVQVPWRPGWGIRAPAAKITGGCELI